MDKKRLGKGKKIILGINLKMVNTENKINGEIYI